ncbi:centromere protein Q isoform X2 [Oryctolagus cuniculus]|uniref:centromere protein Q isoform X2 n=1 Tax=Oryctolagus cuniculus TaxID=9986 RepID=UPI00387A00BD
MKMPGKTNVSKKSQQLKRNPKRKIDDEEVKLPEKEVRKTVKRNKNHTKRLSSEGQTNLKRVKISSTKRKTWQPLSRSTREHLQTMMESVIITILSNSIKDKEQIQYHLNCLKKRLLQLYETLKAPSKKLKDLTNVSSLLNMERAQERVNEDGLTLLQMLQMSSSGVLSLPQLSQNSLKAPTLQKEILTLIPNQDALLKDLDVLHTSSEVKNMLIFIEEAYKKLDAS